MMHPSTPRWRSISFLKGWRSGKGSRRQHRHLSPVLPQAEWAPCMHPVCCPYAPYSVCSGIQLFFWCSRSLAQEDDRNHPAELSVKITESPRRPLEPVITTSAVAACLPGTTSSLSTALSGSVARPAAESPEDADPGTLSYQNMFRCGNSNNQRGLPQSVGGRVQV